MWESTNPVLLEGEMGVDLTAGGVKIGDGVTSWNELEYVLPGPAGEITEVTAQTVAADQPATVELGGTSTARTLAISVPAGPTGANIGDVEIGFDENQVAPGDQVARIIPFDVRQFGADPTGVASSDGAFIAARNAVYAARLGDDPGGTGGGVLRAGIYLPPGTYRITSPKTLMDDMVVTPGATPRTGGLIIQGAGFEATNILYDPTPGNEAGPVFYNDDNFMVMKIEGITFSTTVLNSAPVKPVLWDSKGSGGSKDTFFNYCRFTGYWDKVIRLWGDNTNAQFAFNGCLARRFKATNGFLYSDSALSSDAFVNYWFEQCTFAIQGGYIINAAGAMGHIHVNNCMWLYDPDSDPGTFIRLAKNNVGVNESQLTVENTYFELHEDGQTMLESHWQQGAINFRNTTWNSGGPGDFSQGTSIAAKIYNSNKGIPSITFDSCGMKGVIQYHYDANACLGPQRTILFRRCLLTGITPTTAVTYHTTDGTSLHGGRAAIEFDECVRANLSTDYQGSAISQRFGADRAIGGGGPQPRRMKFTSFRGDLPRSADSTAARTRVLPLGAIITKAELHVVSGGTTATDWSFVFKTTDGAPVTIATLNNFSKQLSNGRDVTVQDLDFVCDTDLRRTITVTQGGTVATGVVGNLYLEYLA